MVRLDKLFSDNTNNMPEAKKRHSPVTGNTKPSKHVINNTDQEQANLDIPEEEIISTPVVEIVPIEEKNTPPPLPPVDVMKSKPILLSIIVETYNGDVDQDGFYHGHGVAILKGGLTYNGFFDHGKMHGEGTLIWPNGTIFTGTLYQNEITGKGMFFKQTFLFWICYISKNCSSARDHFKIF